MSNEKIVDVIYALGELLVVLIKSIFFYGETIYRMFAPAEEQSVKGEIVLVTGAGHGIGKQLALQYAALGATVVAWDINEENNNATVNEIKKRGYPEAYGYVCNVMSRDDVFKTIEKVRNDVGDVNIILNNAGIMPTHPLLEHSQSEIENIMGINVLAHFWIIQAILPSMIKNRHGHIVALSSCAGLIGLRNLVPYCASKYAVVGLMEALEEELKPYPFIKFTTICPYMVKTGLCKRPSIRFESVMPQLAPPEVAATIISAQRQNLRIITLPSYYLYIFNLLKTVPYKLANSLKDIVQSGLDSDL